MICYFFHKKLNNCKITTVTTITTINHMKECLFQSISALKCRVPEMWYGMSYFPWITYAPQDRLAPILILVKLNENYIETGGYIKLIVRNIFHT